MRYAQRRLRTAVWVSVFLSASRMRRSTPTRSLFTPARRPSTFIRPITHMLLDILLAFPRFGVIGADTPITVDAAIMTDIEAATVAGAAIDKNLQGLKV